MTSTALQFEFRSYGPEALGAEVIEFFLCPTHSAAKAKAGRMAKSLSGPVDVAIAGGLSWDERYLTTAIPSSVHASGYQFERLD